jgi:hypothetical protein
MSRRVVEAVKVLDRDRAGDIVHLLERFDENTSDLEWISTLASEGGWVVISGDVRITRSPAERKAWLESGLIAFFLEKGWTNLDLWDLSWRFIKWWPGIVKMAERVRPPAAFGVPVSSSKLRQLQF